MKLIVLTHQHHIKKLRLKMEDIKAYNRHIVLRDYKRATEDNDERRVEGNAKAGVEYIYKNQREDAFKICHRFYRTQYRAISIVKRTKVGMDGLMIEIAKNMTTHPDDDFVLDRRNVFFITGMSNVSWEEDMKEKMPKCFKDNIYHHGKLQRLTEKLNGIKNALIIIDEIDCGDGEDQKLHKMLRDSNVLDMNYMEENNIRLVFVSATMINELKNLKKWGEKHWSYTMTIPDNYIGHNQFLEMGIIQEYYPVNDNESANKWVQEDIWVNYGTDYRVHIIRTDEKNKKFIENACKTNNIEFKNHTSKKDDRISHKDLEKIFDNITKHVVIAIKGFYRRANLIPNKWKMKIGATHEKYTIKGDTNVQVQGLPGRMTGYWGNEIMNGHKTGPHRTSVEAIKEYEEFFKNPLESSKIKYTTNCSRENFMHPKLIKHLKEVKEKKGEKADEPGIIRFDTQEQGLAWFNKYLKRPGLDGPNKYNEENFKNGFYQDSNVKRVLSPSELFNIRMNWANDKQRLCPYRLRPCYRDLTDNKTMEWWLIYGNKNKIELNEPWNGGVSMESGLSKTTND